jgi:hypothetical protein
MKIIIVKSNTKGGEEFNAYSPGLLSYFGIYCFLNQILWIGASSEERCIENVRYKQTPKPKPDKKVVRRVEI